MLGKYGRKAENYSRSGVPHYYDVKRTTWTMEEGTAPINPMKTTQKRTSKEIAHVFPRFFENKQPYEQLQGKQLKTGIILENAVSTCCHIRNKPIIQQGLISLKLSVAIRVRSG